MTGSLQEKNGKYYAVINLTDPFGKRKQKWISTGYTVRGNKKKAEQFLREKIREYEMKGGLVQSDALFSEYVLYWLELTKIRVDEITYQGYESVANAHIIPYFKARKATLQSITRTELQQYFNEKGRNGRIDGKGGLAAQTLRIHKVVIQKTLEEAIKNNILSVNPCTHIVLPKNQRHEPTFYTEEQLHLLLSAIKKEPLSPLIMVTAFYGLRRSEVLGLKWDSVNFERNTITIKYTVVKVTKVVEKNKTKNASSYRSFPMLENIRKLLLQLKEREKKNRELFGNEYHENEYIFKWDNGKPFSPDYVTQRFSRLLELNGLPHIRFHDLRHSCASLLISHDFTLKDIQEWLGHADIKMTANVYSHLETTRKNKLAESMSTSLSGEC